MRTLLLLAFTAVLARADALDALRTRLAALRSDGSVHAVVDYSFSNREGDAAKPEEGRAKATVDETSAGMSIFWGREILDQAAYEMKARTANPNAKTPMRRAMQSLDAETLRGYFDAADGLLRRLDGATLVKDEPSTFQGKPARLLALKLQPKLSKQDQKYIKQADFNARVWVGDDGLPVGAENNISVKGRAMLVITFETTEKDVYRFGRVGDRLVVLSHEKESSGSGGGEHGQQQSRTVIDYGSGKVAVLR